MIMFLNKKKHEREAKRQWKWEWEARVGVVAEERSGG